MLYFQDIAKQFTQEEYKIDPERKNILENIRKTK